MKQPCEVIMWYILPSIRSELAQDLNSMGMNQVEIGKLMNLSQPAVSLYFSEKRGGVINFNDEIKTQIYKLAEDLYDGLATKHDMVYRICEICQKIQEENLVQEFISIHQE